MFSVHMDRHYFLQNMTNFGMTESQDTNMFKFPDTNNLLPKGVIAVSMLTNNCYYLDILANNLYFKNFKFLRVSYA